MPYTCCSIRRGLCVGMTSPTPTGAGVPITQLTQLPQTHKQEDAGALCGALAAEGPQGIVP